ncbi:hypothetical protein VitviT2T_005182 [Vitis vinifera]|uniref:Malectin domain-containing protein n=1 Tax=Vitis vinifera TaxID=29760 RepID=A0ABY9BTB0_VITVI|nr:hypothetical protein VitviT2T_005182 [Vitis vinifera]
MPNSDCRLFYPSLYLLEFLRINIDENIGRPMLPSIPNENAYLNRVVKPIYDLCVEGSWEFARRNRLTCTVLQKHERSESLGLLQDRGTRIKFLGVCSPGSVDFRPPTGTLFFAMSNVGESNNGHTVASRHCVEHLENIRIHYHQTLKRCRANSILVIQCNRLNGNIPDGIKGRQSRTNLFRSFSEEGNLELGGCLENYPCQKDRYSLHINCGGEKSTVGNVVYEGDQYEGGATKFHPMIDYWGFSSTGHFWDHNKTINDYIAQNVSVLGMNHSGLYTRARLSPLSFTYYGRCLANGNYTVKIHFAEIVLL